MSVLGYVCMYLTCAGNVNKAMKCAVNDM